MKRTTGTAWACAAAIVAVGILGLLIAIRAAGGGHGSYATARVFFPYTMILGDLFGRIGIGARILGLLQYPAYALVAWWSAARRRPAAAGGILLTHLAAIAGAYFVRTGVFP